MENKPPVASLEITPIPLRDAPSLRWPRRWWLNALLFALTLLSTTAFGSVLADCFAQGRALDSSSFYDGYMRLIHLDASLWHGLSFALPLLTILLAHELGHYFVCLHNNVDASLPFFLPSPTLLGTFGAFIKIRSPIYTRAILFDIGISGPIAGFFMLLPFLFAGVRLSRVLPGPLPPSDFAFSTPLLLAFAERIIFPHVPSAQILLHPVAIAAWAGLLATAINLLPLGQLDGGHILYAVFGERGHRTLATVFIGILLVLGFYYWPWWGWAVLMFFFGRRHPLVYDTTPLPRGRLALSVVALAVFILSMSVIPVETR